METRIERLRTLIVGDSADQHQDETLNVLIGYAEARFKIILRRVSKVLGLVEPITIPDDLSWVIDEVVIKRFNRIGSEGMRAESVEGHSVQFEADDFADYIGIVEDYYAEELDTGKSRRGRVVGYP